MNIKCSSLLTLGLSITALVGLGSPPSVAVADNSSNTTNIQLLAFNDFHGSIDPPKGEGSTVATRGHDGGTVEVPAGGIAFLATHLKAARAGQEHSTTVAAGDLISKSSLMPTILHQEPTIEMMGPLGLEVSSVGNHEFDQGVDELFRLNNGGCHPVDGCTGDNPYPKAPFRYLAANVLHKQTQQPILPPTWIKDFGDGIRVGFIGMTLKNTPAMGRESNFTNLEFTDEVATANYYAADLEAQHVSSIVVLIHQGGSPTSRIYDDPCNVDGRLEMKGPIVDIAKGLSPSIDVIVSGHTHRSYVCQIPDPTGTPRLVTSAGSHGREFTDISMAYDRSSGHVTHVDARNQIVTRDVPIDGEMTTMIDKFDRFANLAANKPVGYIAGDIRRTAKGESAMGDLVADSQLAATSAADRGGAQIAFASGEGIHTDLPFNSANNGLITYGQVLMTQPFQNPLVTRTLTGAQIIEMLRHQYTTSPTGKMQKILQVSSGLTYTIMGLDDVTDVKLNGQPLDPEASYRVTANGHQADNPGASFSEYFNQGTDETTASKEHEAVAAYLAANSSIDHPLAVPSAHRITIIP